MATDQVYHDGEVAVQQQAGARDVAQRLARVIRPAMPDQHREFFGMLPFVVLGLVDRQGRPWSTFAVGDPGFVSSPDAATLRIGSPPLLIDELGLEANAGDKIGLLGIELSTRRRNRMNGVISQAGQQGLSIYVEQSFGNCPQYIQTRSIEPRGSAATREAAQVVRSESLTDEIAAHIARADTFYIASRTSRFTADPSSGIDASHRGGRPGFVRAGADGVLSFPDFSGNRLFNTLGNIADDGRVGMLFPDFDSGDLVLLTGRASIVWDGERLEGFAGAQRLIDVKADEFVFARSMLPLAGTLIEQSPKLEATGSWQ